ncbi:MAG TPA: PmoA family protein [Bryobacteraceae bacterium]|nr:PmoA family protein [Bryobacteraceae bacterium]
MSRTTSSRTHARPSVGRWKGPVFAAIIGCVFAGVVAAAPVQLKRTGNQIDVLIDGQPFTTYYFSDIVAKPYMMPLRSAAGIVLTRSFPVGNTVAPTDQSTPSFEPHQRGLYFAHGDIDGLNFWAEQAFDKYYPGHSRQAYGRMSLVDVDDISSGPAVGTIRARFNLLAPSRRVIAEETQNFQFHGTRQARTIDCKFVVSATHGPVTFGDTKEGTFAVRLGPELSAPHDHMINSSGAHGEPSIWGKRADWVAYSGMVSGKPVSIAVFEGPKSFRHPTTWHARAYGLLAANPFGAREFTKDPKQDGSWTVPEGESLTFEYRVLIYDGQLSPTQLREAYRQYCNQSQ